MTAGATAGERTDHQPARRRRFGTAMRLATAEALVLVVILGVAVLGLVHAFRVQTSASTTRGLVTEMRSFAAGLGRRPAGQTVDAYATSYLRTRALPRGDLLVVALADGRTLGSAGSTWLLASPRVQAWSAAPAARGSSVRLDHAGHTFLLAATPVVSGHRTLATVAVAGDLTRAESGLGRVRNLAIGEALLALLAGTASAYLLLRGLLRRVGRITATAAGLGRGELDRRLGDQGTDDEVGQLAETFDAMADRVSSAMAAQRQLLSDVSHQLRTPLTVARGHLEVLDRTGSKDPAQVHDTVALVVDEIDHMRALVERLLMLGRALEPDFLELVPVDLRSFCADLTDAARVLAPRDWQISDVPDVVVEVDEAKLRGAMLNLVDNAVRATRGGDVVRVQVDERTDGSLLLAVEDGGPGIPVATRDAVRERFARPGAADSEGSGLGLAIVNAVALAHGGSLLLEDSPLGGLRAVVQLPATARCGMEAV